MCHRAIIVVIACLKISFLIEQTEKDAEKAMVEYFPTMQQWAKKYLDGVSEVTFAVAGVRNKIDRLGMMWLIWFRIVSHHLFRYDLLEYALILTIITEVRVSKKKKSVDFSVCLAFLPGEMRFRLKLLTIFLLSFLMKSNSNLSYFYVGIRIST